MVPTIAKLGSSFKGAHAYYAHDKFDAEGKPRAQTRDRVTWTHTENLPTNNLDTAWKVMAFTANDGARLKREAGVRPGGRKQEKPVFHFSLSWHPGQKPDRDHMLEAAKAAIAFLGLSEHQTMIYARTRTGNSPTSISSSIASTRRRAS